MGIQGALAEMVIVPVAIEFGRWHEQQPLAHRGRTNYEELAWC